MSVTPFRPEPGVSHFVCTDCEIEVYSYGTPRLEPVCMTCQWIRGVPEDCREEVRALLRNDFCGNG